MHDFDELSLQEERHSWRDSMLKGQWQDPHILKEYRLHRNSELWRCSRQAEKLCEYILYLESLMPSRELHSNLFCYLGKNINQGILNDIILQIVESIDFFLNKKDA